MSYLDYEGLQVLKGELDKAFSGIIVSEASGAIASFPDGADAMPVKSLVCQINPVQEGEGDPSPDNVRPITGFTGLNIEQRNINLAPTSVPSNIIAGTFTTSAGSIRSASNARVFAFPVPKGCDICVQKLSGSSSSHVICLGDTGNIAVGTPIYNPLGFSNADMQNINTGTHSWLYVQSGGVDSAYSLFATDEFMVSVGTGRKSYVAPHNGTTYPISWQTEAGTIYGGTLDVTNGVLTVDRANIASYNGESLPGEWISDRDVYVPGTNPTVGAQVVYELATPQTYQLTPQEVTMLLGANNIWADCGTTSVVYSADTKRYIDAKLDTAIAELQALILES